MDEKDIREFEETEDRLDSIVWQIEKRDKELSGDTAEIIYQIADRYKSPLEALKFLDNHLGDYRGEDSLIRILQILDNKDRRAVQFYGDYLTISELKKRFKSALLENDNDHEPTRNYGKRNAIRGGYQLDPSPWQENAIRALEGD